MPSRASLYADRGWPRSSHLLIFSTWAYCLLVYVSLEDKEAQEAYRGPSDMSSLAYQIPYQAPYQFHISVIISPSKITAQMRHTNNIWYKMIPRIPWNLSFCYILFHEERLQMMLWYHNIRVNSHQRLKQTRFRVCFHLWCKLTSTMNVTERQVSWNSWYAWLVFTNLKIFHCLHSLAHNTIIKTT